MVERAQDWLSRHAAIAGVVMAAIMALGFTYGIISWADAQTNKLAALTDRVSVLEIGRSPISTALAQEDQRLTRIETKLTDLSNFIMGKPPQ